MHVHVRAALAVVCLACAATVATGRPALQRIRGDVAAVHGKDLDVRTSAGDVVTVRMADSVRISARSRADVAQVAPGAFIGTTAVAQPDGTLKAVEVHVFPESMRGTGEGHRPMDTERGSTMTNATVKSVTPSARPRSTMTNATVAAVAGADAARRITLTYKGGEQTVVIGRDVPVVIVEPGEPAMLVPGAHVIVTAATQPDGSLLTERISVGRNELVPPI